MRVTPLSSVSMLQTLPARESLRSPLGCRIDRRGGPVLGFKSPSSYLMMAAKYRVVMLTI